jgi:ADP-ribose pyrophosphatase YjhB (NUDIX family)
MPTLGASAVIFDPGANVLLCHRTDRDMWNLPGGRVELAEAPWDAVVREVFEDIGLLVRVERLLGVYSVPKKKDLVFSFLCVPIGGVLTSSEEADRVGWFSKMSIPANTLVGHVERIEDAYTDRARPCVRVQR